MARRPPRFDLASWCVPGLAEAKLYTSEGRLRLHVRPDKSARDTVRRTVRFIESLARNGDDT